MCTFRRDVVLPKAWLKRSVGPRSTNSASARKRRVGSCWSVGPRSSPRSDRRRIRRARWSGCSIRGWTCCASTCRTRPRASRRRRCAGRAPTGPDVAVLADLGGPKLRLGDLPTEINDRAGRHGRCWAPAACRWPIRRCSTGSGPAIRSSSRTGPSPSSPPRCGAIASSARSGSAARCASRKGINLPNDTSSLPALTDKDRARSGGHRRAGARLRRRSRTSGTSATSPRRAS